MTDFKELPKEAPDEVHRVSQAIIAKFQKARKDPRDYVYYVLRNSGTNSEAWSIADNFERNEALIFKVKSSEWYRRDIYTGSDSRVIGGVLKSVRAWKTRQQKPR